MYLSGVESNFILQNSGVPQGSLLGPFEILFIYDMIKSTNSLSVRHFADDTLTATGKDLDVLIHQTNCEVPLIIYEWLWSDKLPLNAMQILDVFSAMSGPRLNYKKKEVLWIATKAGSEEKLCPESDLKWMRYKVKTLGVLVHNRLRNKDESQL